MKNYTPNLEIGALDDEVYLPAKEFFKKYRWEALTYGEITLATHQSKIWPGETNPISHLTDKITLSTPIISADMDTVTESDMAIEMALAWGLWILHSNLDIDQQIEELRKVKSHLHWIIKRPLTVTPEGTIGEIIAMKKKEWIKFSTFPVLWKDWKLIGLLGSKAVKQRYSDRKVGDLMTNMNDITTITEEMLWKDPIWFVDNFFTEHMWVTKLPIIDKKGLLQWLVDESDIHRIITENNSDIQATRDGDHRLRAWVTLHMLFKDWDLDKNRILENTERLVEAWVDIVAVSTAHGLSENVWKMVALVRENFKDLDIMAGNITSGRWVEFLKNAWANVVKIWQWPGSICTTRTQTWVWIPQATAVHICSQAANILWDVRIIADWGITCSWDMVKAYALWGDAVMLGWMLAWCKESPWELFEFKGELFKSYRGMWSIEAMKAWSAARYWNVNDSKRKLAPEWIPAAKKFIWSVSDVVWKFRASIQSWMWYNWAENLETHREKARFVKMNDAWQKESAPHDVIPMQSKIN